MGFSIIYKVGVFPPQRILWEF